jgi:hypothetical protein
MIIETKYGKAEMTSPFEVQSYPVAIPPLRDELVLGAVKLKLRSLYPGHPGISETDFIRETKAKPNKGTANLDEIRGFAFTAPIDTVLRLRDSALPIVHPIQIATEAVLNNVKGLKGTTPPDAVIVETDQWILVAPSTDRGPTNSLSFQAPLSVHDSALLKDFLSLNCDTHKPCMRITWNDGIGIAIPEKHEIPLEGESVALGIDPRKIGLFRPPRKDSTKIHRGIILALCVLNCIAICFYANRNVRALEKRAITVKEQYEERKKKNARTNEIEAELARIRAPAHGEGSNTIADPYGILSILRNNLHGASIRAITIQPSYFRLEAEGADVLAVIASLQSTNAFTKITLRQSAPSPIKGDVFSIAGEF